MHPGLSVLDVGTGTGVLARIARARGASLVHATDIDTEALNAARANAKLDASENKIIFSENLPDHWGASFDLVIANILENPLRSLRSNLAGALKSGGFLLLSGFTPLQTPLLRTAFEQTELNYVSDAVLDNWALLMLQKKLVISHFMIGSAHDGAFHPP